MALTSALNPGAFGGCLRFTVTLKRPCACTVLRKRSSSFIVPLPSPTIFIAGDGMVTYKHTRHSQTKASTVPVSG